MNISLVAPMEKIIYLALVIFNIFALLMVFELMQYTQVMLATDLVIVFFIKSERILTYYITRTNLSKIEVAKLLSGNINNEKK